MYAAILRVRSCIFTALFLAFMGAAAVAATAPAMPWHLPDWKYRQVVELLQQDSSGKVDTGLIELAEAPPRIAPDGADVRVIDENGQAVAFQVVTRLGEPLHGAQPAGESFRIHFRVVQSAHFYAVYFGNPKAASAAGEWPKKLGGLSLETRANSGHSAPGSLRDMLALLSQSKLKYGEGFRRRIDDPENPFGPNEQFISIYRGSVYCPEDGPYVFSTDSDDASFLLIDGQLAAQQGTNRRTPLGTFEPGSKLDLKAGIHRIEYYHVQLTGGSLARAGWQTPGTTEIVTIPEDNFVRELPTDMIITETRESPVNAFFVAKTLNAVSFGNEGPVFTTILFTDKSRSAYGKIALREWDFGDGDISLEEAPRHVFEGGAKRTVTLRCTDVLGCESIFSREIPLPQSGNTRGDAELEAIASQPILLPDEKPSVRLSARFSIPPPVQARLITEILFTSGEPLRYEQTLVPEPGKWTSLVPPLGALDTAALSRLRSVNFSLELARKPVIVRSFDILSAADNRGKLRASGESVITETGQPVILRLSGDHIPRPAKGDFPKLAGKGGALCIAVVDDSLAGKGNGGYPMALAGLIRARYPETQLRLERVGRQEDGSPADYNALAAAVGTPEKVAALRPDVVVLAVSLRDILRLEPVERFERNLQAMAERVQAATGAQVVLVAPPPVIVNPALSQAYELAVKRVGMRKNIRVADAYSAFIRAGEASNGWRTLYKDPGGETPLYHVAPAAEGQKLIGEIVFKALEKE